MSRLIRLCFNFEWAPTPAVHIYIIILKGCWGCGTSITVFQIWFPWYIICRLHCTTGIHTSCRSESSSQSLVVLDKKKDFGNKNLKLRKQYTLWDFVNSLKKRNVLLNNLVEVNQASHRHKLSMLSSDLNIGTKMLLEGGYTPLVEVNQAV